MIQKNKLKEIIYNKKYFYYPYFIFVILSSILLSFLSNPDITLWINNNHFYFFDKYFLFFSYIGNGELFGIVLLIMGMYKVKFAFDGLAFYLGSNLITHIIKFYVNAPRPLAYFNENILNPVQGEELYRSFSFPSGHTTSGFAIFLYLTFLINNRKYTPLFIFAAIMVGFSRVYLLQHFYIDIFVASIISVISCTYIYLLIENSEKLQTSKWYNYSLIKKFKK